MENTKHTPTPWYISKNEMRNPAITTQKPGQPYTMAGEVCTSVRRMDDAEFIVRAVNSHDALLKFAKEHHEVCSECEGTGKIYKHNDPTTMQWVPCPYAEAIAQVEGK
jgi:hypothetical protein